ncbi:MAG: hypothetical protein R3245_01785 [Kiloniellales bacterium]|nr:hypothetical protein [Kiloniellales bacterium]
MTFDRQTVQWLTGASRTSSTLLGGFVVFLAFAAMISGEGVSEIGRWAWEVLGVTFIVLLTSLVFITVFSWTRMDLNVDPDQRELWMTAGLQAANGIATLALTYTLFGISLGISSLAGQELTPDTVQGVIQTLTAQFSTAFMTSVIGLPLSALMRAILLVRYAALAPAEGDAAFPQSHSEGQSR